MVQQYFAPNMNAVAQEAQAAKERAAAFNSDGLPRYDWVEGEQVFRLLWAYNAAGATGKMVYTHFYGAEREPCRCPQLTYPEAGLVCQGCSDLNEIQAVRPDLDLGQSVARAKWYTQCTLPWNGPRGDDTVTLVQFPQSFRNWMTLQMMSPHVGDITNPMRGVLVSVTKKIKGKRQRCLCEISDTMPISRLIKKRKRAF